MRVAQELDRRKGLTSVVVLVLLVVLTIIAGALLRLSSIQRDRLRAAERRLQAEWLAQAGLDRALFKLASDSKYAGETWELSPADLAIDETKRPANGPAAVVSIKVESSQPQGEKLIEVVADYPPDPASRTRHSMKHRVTLDSIKTGESR
jgi:flagellin-like protein